MTHLLVYTENYYVQSAIESLADDQDSVIYFRNKTYFLVCATILNDSMLLIDAIDNNGTVRWLYEKLTRNRKSPNINFITSPKVLSVKLVKDLSLITNILQLKSLCRYTGKTNSKIIKKGIYGILIEKLHRKLPSSDVVFILTLYDAFSGKRRSLTKQELNRAYYIRSKKLSLNNSSEFKILISFLSGRIYPSLMSQEEV